LSEYLEINRYILNCSQFVPFGLNPYIVQFQVTCEEDCTYLPSALIGPSTLLVVNDINYSPWLSLLESVNLKLQGLVSVLLPSCQRKFHVWLRPCWHTLTSNDGARTGY